MSSYAWSASRAAFFPIALEATYRASGGWPSDAVAVDDATYETMKTAPDGKQLVAGPGGTPSRTDIPRSLLQQRREAAAALAASDVTVLRCVERGITVPAEWADYRGALRLLVSSDVVETGLPTRPDYPAGT